MKSTALWAHLPSLLFIAILFGCGCAEQAMAEEAAGLTAAASVPLSNVIRIGVAGPHSGNLAAYGLPTLNAVRIIASKYNAVDGLLGKQIEVLNRDDLCYPEIAASVAYNLVEDGVDVVVGHICSGATNSAIGIYRDAKVVSISPSATNPDLTQSGDYPNFFRTIASDDRQARLEVDFALDVLKLEKIAVLHDQGAYGKGLVEFAKAFLEKDPRAEVVLYEGITPGDVDYSAVIQKIKHSNAEAVIFGGYYTEASKIVSQMRKMGMDTIFISDDGVKDDNFIKLAGDFAEGVYTTGPKDVSKIPLAISAIKEHQDTYGADPGAFYLNAYAATLALLNAIDQAGDPKNYDAIVQSLRTDLVDTPLGEIRFDDHGDPIGVGFTVYQVQDGTFIELNDGTELLDGGYDVTANLWTKAVLETPGSPVTLQWKMVGADITPSGDQVISGYFYADPNDFAYGSLYNPELFVKIYIASNGWCNMAFNHVTVDDVSVYSMSGGESQSSTATLNTRLVEHQYNGVSIDNTLQTTGETASASSSEGYTLSSDLWTKAVLQPATGAVNLIWKEVGTDTTPSGDTVVSGYFYASPEDFPYGSLYNPEVFVKVYIATNGWCNMAFNHVTVDGVDISSALNYGGTTDQAGTTTLQNRLVEHQYDGVGYQQ